ncbi:MAG: hypothetical protein JXR51_04880 [Bacteroidales bacterium]|nr:hypothetical protein [Bacteroidales bacterium]MBN2756493.1 hypothetical protein [Bacteroidales bacterium]
MIFEEYKKDNLKYYKQILDFLGVNNSFIFEFKEVNANLEVRNIYIKSFFIKFTRFVIKTAKLFFPEKLAKKIEPAYYKIISKITVKKASRKKINEELKIKLKQKYKNNVFDCQQFIDKNLFEIWKY